MATPAPPFPRLQPTVTATGLGAHRRVDECETFLFLTIYWHYVLVYANVTAYFSAYIITICHRLKFLYTALINKGTFHRQNNKLTAPVGWMYRRVHTA
jgi:hypothetical protein